ncbi:MAG: putative metal-binding motif-containing protein [Candidatus Woesearchaeota archaeon]|jgi:hypothetical protein
MKKSFLFAVFVVVISLFSIVLFPEVNASVTVNCEQYGFDAYGCFAESVCCGWSSDGCYNWCAGPTSTCGNNDCPACGSPFSCEFYDSCMWDYQGVAGCVGADTLFDFNCFQDHDGDSFVSSQSAFTLRGSAPTAPNACSLNCNSMTDDSCLYAPSELCAWSGTPYCSGQINCASRVPENENCGAYCSYQSIPAGASHCGGRIDCSEINNPVECQQLTFCRQNFNCLGELNCADFSNSEIGCTLFAPPGCITTDLGAGLHDCVSSSGNPISCSIFTTPYGSCAYYEVNNYGCTSNFSCENPQHYIDRPSCNVFDDNQTACVDHSCMWFSGNDAYDGCTGAINCGIASPLESCESISDSSCKYYPGADCAVASSVENYIPEALLQVANGGIDCNDSNANIYPGAPEVCSSTTTDYDCDGLIGCNDIDNCSTYPNIDPSCELCGNGQIDDLEECDGTNLDGQTCASLGGMVGTLSCTSDCHFTGCTQGCTQFDTNHNYVEIKNSSDSTLARIDQAGRFWIRGQKKPWTTTGMTGHDFVLQDSTGAAKLWIKSTTGDLYVSGSVNEHVASNINPTGTNNFIVKDRYDATKVWVTSTGTVNIRDCLGQNKTFGGAGGGQQGGGTA